LSERLACTKCGNVKLELNIISHEDERYVGKCSVCGGTEFAFFPMEQL